MIGSGRFPDLDLCLERWVIGSFHKQVGASWCQAWVGGGAGVGGGGVELSAKSLLPLEMPSLGLGTWPRGEGVAWG